MDAKLLLIKVLITRGALILKESYYGDDLDFDRMDFIDSNIDSYLNGINFDKTTLPIECVESRFDSIYQDSDTLNTVIRCEIVMNYGVVDLWKLNCNDMSICDLICLSSDLM